MEVPNSKVPSTEGDYFLIVSRLSAYKNIDLAIRACNQLRRPLKIVGAGRQEKYLKSLAGPTIEFLGFVDEFQLNKLYQGCLAFLYTTADEDFGLTPLEANAHGKPVIALRSGGVKETMVEGQTALFFEEPTTASLIAALNAFDPKLFSAAALTANAQRFSQERFQKELKEFINERCHEFTEGSL